MLQTLYTYIHVTHCVFSVVSSEVINYTAECSKAMQNIQLCLSFDPVFVDLNPVVSLESSLMKSRPG